MNYEHEKGKKALELCLNMHHIKDEELVYIGLTREDITQIKNGNKYMTEDQLYNFAFVMRSPNMIQRPLVDWLNCGGLWALAGIAEPTFSLNNISIRAIMYFPYVFINNPDVHISIDDTIIHTYHNGHKEELYIENIDYDPYSRGYNPIYKLTVTRSKQNMHNTNNFNFGDNTQIGGNARFNAGNVTDNSTNEIHELPPDFFSHVRELLMKVEDSNRKELLEILSKIEEAKSKREGVHWFGKFISSAADYITILQPAIAILGRYFFS